MSSPQTAAVVSSPQTAADLRRRARRLREIAREFPTDETATRLRELAGELDELAATLDPDDRDDRDDEDS